MTRKPHTARAQMYIFGGYDGSNRVNDFYSFDLKTRQWNIVPAAVRARAPDAELRSARAPRGLTGRAARLCVSVTTGRASFSA